VCAGTLRPHGRQTDAAAEQAGASAAAAGTGWQPPPIVFQGADDTETPSTPTRVKQLLKRGVVKFKEVSFCSGGTDQSCDCTNPVPKWHLPASDAYGTTLAASLALSTVHTSCIPIYMLHTSHTAYTLHAPRIHLYRLTACSSGHATRIEHIMWLSL